MLYSHAGIFSEWPKPAQPYFLSLGVTAISMDQPLADFNKSCLYSSLFEILLNQGSSKYAPKQVNQQYRVATQLSVSILVLQKRLEWR